MFQIDKSCTRPMYLQIIESIIDQIQHGQLKFNDRLPTEENCQLIYGISSVIVKKAYGELRKRGYISRLRGLGTYVSYQPNLIIEMGALPNLLAINSRVQPQLILKERVQKDSPLFRYKFLFHLDVHLLGQQEIVTSENMMVNLPKLYSSLLSSLPKSFDINVIEAKSADDALSFVLHTAPGSAVTLVINQTTHVMVKTYLRADLIQLAADAYGD